MVAAVGAGLGTGCASLRQSFSSQPATDRALPLPGHAPWAEVPPRLLSPVFVSPEREIRTIVGLRPFRATGFRVAAERLADKIVVHNYGHGGGGVTLSWGTSHLAVEEAQRAIAEAGLSSGWGGGGGEADAASEGNGDLRTCAVVGCGAVGLSTAILMQRRGWRVVIYARDLPPNTTSNVAGALWDPYSVSDPGRTTPEYDGQFARAARLAHSYFQEMVGDDYGIRWIETYRGGDGLIERPWFPAGTDGFFPEARELRPQDHPFPVANAIVFNTMLIEPHTYLRALMRDFRVAGGRIVVREFTDRRELATLPVPLIFNCTGLGSRDLFEDAEMNPIKGQLTFLLPQPEVDYTVIADSLYMFPRSDGILLGGTFERGVWSMEPNLGAKQRVLAGHRRLFGWDDATAVAARDARGWLPRSPFSGF